MGDLIGRWLPYTLLACFAVFLLTVFKGPGRVTGRREKSPGAVRLGAFFQSIAYMFAWMFRRPWPSPFGGAVLGRSVLIALASLSAAVGAIVLVFRAKKRLGRQWALAARVIEGHDLVIDGPFGRVRHPLYVAMGLLLLSPVICLSSWLGAALALPLFAIGTLLRVRAEEAVLVETFGSRYEDYRRRVPAFLPRFKRRR
jgi:protein-S-isoprenylcysteine O-methyltransferase Ste14